ncbi:molybdenum ABC transporter substrate-binding protein [Paraburkholderia caffeinilytica]|uniref:Molybdenum ABC transporter substrate-binding protein n=1 Tax=Paraburkholderia caffeinilytica TaxID=1761016 RepID=A0ABQ1LU77_9BURK|nr:substrate-binding domain-containing protein [Paraburkholderia caffeinilytica]AXL53426.1 molybdenum ABC transporter substrate-binding protein [Paraburkholderia caffeinilytica]GGC29740.1 hypothetical protein GCM10011400_15410 [Paraburkholderia caffeinilytica]CAB3781546.1 Aconitate isomerase [Paraburkholderia caffeinilytica]
MSSESQSVPLTIVSSMATRHVLTQLADAYQRESGQTLSVLSVGGVEAARRVRNGEHFDIVILASDAIGKLIDGGHVIAETRTDVARSRIAVAVRSGEPHRDISSEDAVRDAVLRARSVGYSTGPSGTHVIGLLGRWGVAGDQNGPRIVEASPGVPVGSLIAEGKVEIGFQQLSELIHQPGIDVIGMLPASIQAVTVFSAAICNTTTRREAAMAFLEFLSSPANDADKVNHGMEPVQG